MKKPEILTVKRYPTNRKGARQFSSAHGNYFLSYGGGIFTWHIAIHRLSISFDTKRHTRGIPK